MSQLSNFAVVLEPQREGGFTVRVPALPDIVTEGDTEAAALAMAEETIRMVLDCWREYGIAIAPDAPPTLRAVTVPVHGARDLKTGTLRGIIRQAGLTIEEFGDFL